MILKHANFINPAAKRVFAGAAMGGVAGGLGGAALDRENRGRGALLGGAGGALLGAGAGHLANRAVNKAVGQVSARAASEAGALRNELSALQEAQKMPSTRIRQKMLARDFPGLSVPAEMTDESHSRFLEDLARAAGAEARGRAHNMLNHRQQFLGEAIQAGNVAEAQEHYARLAELIGRLGRP